MPPRTPFLALDPQRLFHQTKDSLGQIGQMGHIDADAGILLLDPAGFDAKQIDLNPQPFRHFDGLGRTERIFGDAVGDDKDDLSCFFSSIPLFPSYR